MTKSRIPLATARVAAERIRGALVDHADAFSRVEIAGSIRRQKPEVGDLELVAEIDPNREFGATDRIRRALAGAGVVRAPPTVRTDGVSVRAPWGDRYMKGAYVGGNEQEVQVDLFIARPPADFAVIYLIRTGSALFSQAVVTRLHRYGLRSEMGRLLHRARASPEVYYDDPVPCDTEETVFALAHLPYLPPDQRDMEIPTTAALFEAP